jgi:hypothetical protein
VHSDILPFFGCSCRHCQKKFESEFGYPLPLKEKRGKQILDYLVFRENSVSRLLEALAAIVHNHQKEFGINLYDPYLRNDVLFYGYRLEAIQPFLDYLFIENHSLPSQSNQNNAHLLPLILRSNKPVFIVSYKNGIGFERQFSQKDFNAIASESDQLGYQPCYKVTEFTTNGKWHTLDCRQIKTVQPQRQKPTTKVSSPERLQHSKRRDRALIQLVQKHVSAASSLIHEKKWIWAVASRTGVYKNQLKKTRLYTPFG